MSLEAVPSATEQVLRFNVPRLLNQAVQRLDRADGTESFIETFNDGKGRALVWDQSPGESSNASARVVFTGSKAAYGILIDKLQQWVDYDWAQKSDFKSFEKKTRSVKDVESLSLSRDVSTIASRSFSSTTGNFSEWTESSAGSPFKEALNMELDEDVFTLMQDTPFEQGRVSECFEQVSSDDGRESVLVSKCVYKGKIDFVAFDSGSALTTLPAPRLNQLEGIWDLIAEKCKVWSFIVNSEIDDVDAEQTSVANWFRRAKEGKGPLEASCLALIIDGEKDQKEMEAGGDYGMAWWVSSSFKADEKHTRARSICKTLKWGDEVRSLRAYRDSPSWEGRVARTERNRDSFVDSAVFEINSATGEGVCELVAYLVAGLLRSCDTP